MIVFIDPVPKPRMTQRDKWAKRPAVLRYREFCDQVRAAGVPVPDEGAHITFCIPMPKSWAKKKRALLEGQPHRQKPDVDNLLKALMDAVHSEDQGVWDVRITKRWSEAGSISIEPAQA